MKKIVVWACALLFSGIWTGCGKDKFEKSIYGREEPGERNELQQWLFDNYVVRYNIDVIYVWRDMEQNLDYLSTPPRQDTVIPFMKMVHTGWILPYLELCGAEQIKPLLPKQIQLFGSAGYHKKSNGVVTLGTADGKKLMLYDLDNYNPKDRETVKKYIRIMHHECGHLLNYYKAYPLSFKQISTSYDPAWYNVDERTSVALGFVSGYSRENPDEDFVETLAEYVTDTPEEWAALLTEAGSGSADILRKTDVVRTYMEENWGVDMDELRNLVILRIDDVVAGNYK